MNWSTFLTICAQITIACIVARFCTDLIMGAVGDRGTKRSATPSVRDLVAKARAQYAARKRDGALVDTTLDTPPVTQDTEVIPAVNVTPATKA